MTGAIIFDEPMPAFMSGRRENQRKPYSSSNISGLIRKHSFCLEKGANGVLEAVPGYREWLRRCAAGAENSWLAWRLPAEIACLVIRGMSPVVACKLSHGKARQHPFQDMCLQHMYPELQAALCRLHPAAADDDLDDVPLAFDQDDGHDSSDQDDDNAERVGVAGDDDESAATFDPTFLVSIGTTMAAWSKDILAGLEPAEKELSQVHMWLYLVASLLNCVFIHCTCVSKFESGHDHSKAGVFHQLVAQSFNDLRDEILRQVQRGEWSAEGIALHLAYTGVSVVKGGPQQQEVEDRAFESGMVRT